MSKKVRKFPLFLVSILVLLVVSAFVVYPSFGTFAGEKVQNGGFEDASNWTVNEGEFELSDSDPYAGTYCLNESMDDASAGLQITQLFAVKVPAEDVGYLSFYANSGGTSIFICVWVIWETAGYVQYYIGDPHAFADWTLVNSTLTNDYAGDSVLGVFIQLSCLGGSNWIALDSFSVSYDSGATPPADDDATGLFADAMRFLVPVICLILPAFILGFFMKMGSWGYIIGLCVGAGLGFMAFPAYVPLWLVFVCILGAIGMLWRTSHT